MVHDRGSGHLVHAVEEGVAEGDQAMGKKNPWGYDHVETQRRVRHGGVTATVNHRALNAACHAASEYKAAVVRRRATWKSHG